jgi:hypothetical protein
MIRVFPLYSQTQRLCLLCMWSSCGFSPCWQKLVAQAPSSSCSWGPGLQRHAKNFLNWKMHHRSLGTTSSFYIWGKKWDPKRLSGLERQICVLLTTQGKRLFAHVRESLILLSSYSLWECIFFSWFKVFLEVFTVWLSSFLRSCQRVILDTWTLAALSWWAQVLHPVPCKY